MEGGYGPTIYIEDLFGIKGFHLTETIVNMWLVMGFLLILAFVFTRNLKVKPKGPQLVVEMIYTTLESLVISTMGEKNRKYFPYMGSLFVFLLFGNTMGLLGLRPPTADFHVTFPLALMTFLLIQANGIIHNGIGGYFKGFFQPMGFLFPINVVGELANPISLSFRLFGNMIGGLIIMNLLYTGLISLSSLVFGAIPVFGVGIPLVFNFYFDIFSGVLQSIIFTMLSMVLVKMAQE